MATIGNVKKIVSRAISISMPSIAFFGRLVFAFVFILSAIQAYAEHYGDGGPLEKTVGPIVNVVTKLGSKVLTFFTGMQVVSFDVRLLEFTFISAKGTAGLWFIFGGSIPAYFLLVTQVISTLIPLPTNSHDFAQNLTLIGALLFYIGYKHAIDELLEAEKKKKKEE
ncbi:PREDICTED: uncharacterized protein LOC104808611 [Tarenaya hassleriana]|uniref:uncharacterized protein LOC104808611 n=1 Tax=Tarenaya hassleriana TaxID=28532 RepID=UPI00053C0992|nr:PREDICTED: uncharacterized protein LOC104808611 [Tarenaya hassleriana]